MTAGALEPYRILDLTTQRGWLAGKLLADLGATVVKIEPPEGDPGRMTGPFVNDGPGPDASLNWLAYNRGKQSVVVDLSSDEGRARFLELLAGADAVLESFDPGKLEGWSLGTDALLAVNPRLVVTRITPFGQDGPYSGYAGEDLVLSAIGGAAWLIGNEDRAPVRVTAPQCYPHAAAEAALHTVVGLFHAGSTGQGQQFDVAAQSAVVRTLLNNVAHALTDGRMLRRETFGGPSEHTPFRSLFRCEDGYVVAMFGMGPGILAMRRWAQEDGDAIPAALAEIEESNLADLETSRKVLTPDMVAVIHDWLDAFFAARTRQRIVEGASKRRLQFFGVNTVADLLADDQLAARGYYQSVELKGGRTTYFHPQLWAHLAATPIKATPRAPGIGEHDGQPERGAVTQPANVNSGSFSGDVFSGLKVWDASWVGVGPLTTRYLGDYGATVVRTESSRNIDVLRHLAPFKDGEPGLNRSQFFAEYNCSKLGLGVNFATPEGLSIAKRLAAWADVVVESFRPGVMDRLGIGYDVLREINPAIIQLSTSINGQTGPRRTMAGFGTGLVAMAGFVEPTGWPDRAPCTPFGAYTDFVAQRFCGTALVAALDHRRRTGEGQYIDVSQFEASAQFFAPYMIETQLNGRTLTRAGNRDPAAAPHGIFRCRDEDDLDRWIAIAVATDAQWASLVARMGSPAWALEPRFATLADRKANEDELEALIGEWTAGKSRMDLFYLLQPDVPAAPVQTNADLIDDPQLRHRGYFHILDHAEMGPMTYEGSQALASLTPAYPRKAAPLFGADNIMILREFLGFDTDEVEALLASGAVET